MFDSRFIVFSKTSYFWDFQVLLEDVKYHRKELDSTKLEAYRGTEFPSVLKDLDDLTLEIESHITRLRHLLLLQQQYNAHITDITTFISKYRDVVKEIDKSPGSVESKIKEFDGVIAKLGECDAQLVSASEKGLRIAEELTIEDRNAISENLNSLKQQLHALRTDTFRLRSEHELTAAEFKNLAKDLETAINALHGQEAEIKSRPTLSMISDDDEDVFRRHAQLADECKKHILVLESTLNALKDTDALPPSLIEQVNEARLLNRTVPEELRNRLKYLEDNKNLREQLNHGLESLLKWVNEAESKLPSSDAGINFETLQRELKDHKAYFSSHKNIDDQVQNVQKIADKVFPSLVAGEQDALRKKISDLTQRVQDTLSRAKTHQTCLEQNSTLWDKYIELLEVVQTAINDSQAHVEPATSLVALKSNSKTLAAALCKLQVISVKK